MTAPVNFALQPGDVVVTQSVVAHVTPSGHVVSEVSDGYLFLSPQDVELVARGTPPAEPSGPATRVRRSQKR